MPQALRLKIEGPPNRVSADALARALTESLGILGNISRAVTGRSPRARNPLTWYVTDLSASSSAIAVLEAEPAAEDVEAEIIPVVGNEYVDGLRAVETGTALPRYLTETSLNRLDRIAKPLGHPFAENLDVEWGDGPHPNATKVTNHSLGNLAELRAPRITSIGSITGVLDFLSARGKPTFQVTDDLWKRPVIAEFAERDIEDIKAAFPTRVSVSGIVLRNAKGQPIRVREPRLSVLPDGPPLSEIVGVARDFLGDQTLRDYMESIG